MQRRYAEAEWTRKDDSIIFQEIPSMSLTEIVILIEYLNVSWSALFMIGLRILTST